MLLSDKTGLLLIDVQGTLATMVADSDGLIARLQALITGAQALDLPIVWVEQNPQKLGQTVPALRDLLPTQQPVTKFTFNACACDEVMQQIEQTGRRSWLVTGIEAHICVYQTAAQLHARGFDTHLVVDAIASRTLSNQTLATQKLATAGVNLTSVEMCLYEMVQDCRAPAFKIILESVKAAHKK